uniref:Uncharacterized protein n=1 Tax=Utricularia reniformis TaxID=192314 RepID=A0A1Y0B170_9LAMI|nr:hypothetical protein AEK19_MT0972 [Utricularia reniformis]ART31195.1 hypothetical protein AEK19_MT0972 [Utricularia reniformis]
MLQIAQTIAASQVDKVVGETDNIAEQSVQYQAW